MVYLSIAFLALAAAQSADGAKWVPLNSGQPAASAASQPLPAQSAIPDPVAVAPVVQISPAPLATPASAAPEGVVLWRNIESGMTVAKVRSLYPQAAKVSYRDDRTVLSDVSIIEGCQAKVNIMHPAGSVSEIVMRGEGAIAGRCSLKIITALSGKYGEPLEKDKVQGSLFARQGKNYVWSRDGVTLQFKRYTSGALGGGGLFAASWELRYSENAKNIDL